MPLISNEEPDKSNPDWEQILEFIATKRTHEKAFQALFEKILSDEGSPHYNDAKTLKMLYDFTPLRPDVKTGD